MFEFHLTATDGTARAGELATPHGLVETPVFMPVGTQATVKTLTVEQLDAAGVTMLLGNTYHLHLRPGEDTVAALGGLHRFMNWPRPILTDSGGFQVFSLAELRKVTDDGVVFQSHIDGSRRELTPESVLDIEAKLGADVVMPLDECAAFPAEKPHAKDAMERTIAWAQRSVEHHRRKNGDCPDSGTVPDLSGRQAEGRRIGDSPNGNKTGTVPNSSVPVQTLFGIVQGATYADLRVECARRLVAMDFPGYAIGGLSVGEGPQVMNEMLDVTVPELPRRKPHYLMGVGPPGDLLAAIARGIDMFDCVLPTRNGRNGFAFTSTGIVRLKNLKHARSDAPLDASCLCPTCASYSRGYLRHLFRSKELLGMTLASLHNLAFFTRLMRDARRAIVEKRFDAFCRDFLATQVEK